MLTLNFAGGPQATRFVCVFVCDINTCNMMTEQQESQWHTTT